jgi:hypothetical protein
MSGDSATVTTQDLDFILTAQIAIGWAGESGEPSRLGWWNSDLASEFGGEDLLQRLLPHTWQWAVLQGTREAARRFDAGLREKDHNPDRLCSLYNLGFELDERVEERLQDLKRSGRDPKDALPKLRAVLQEDWDQASFAQWLQGYGAAEHTTAPVGRRIRGDLPAAPGLAVSQLISALLPLSNAYPLPHFRRTM